VHTILSANKNVWDQDERRCGENGRGTDSRWFVDASSRHYGGLCGISRSSRNQLSHPKLSAGTILGLQSAVSCDRGRHSGWENFACHVLHSDRVQK
jgi:hypothetical protein